MVVFIGRSTKMDRWETIVHYSSLSEDVLSNWYALKEGIFLVLEVIQEYENSGKWVRMQGKYLPVIRRHILGDYGLSSGDNDHHQRLWKAIKDKGWLSKDY